MASVVEAFLQRVIDSPVGGLTALGHDGFRIAWPESLPVSADRLLPLPAHRVTMLDMVIPAHIVPVAEAWERVLLEGSASVEVELRHVPGRLARIDFLDAHAETGVLLGSILPSESPADDGTSSDLPAGALSTTERPRSARVTKNPYGVILDVDDAAVGMLGLTREEMLGARSTEFIHPEDTTRAIEAFINTLSTRKSSRCRLRHRCGDGSWLWVESEHRSVLGEDGEVTLVADMQDISAEREALEATERQSLAMRKLLERLPVGLVHLPKDTSGGFVNTRAGQILGSEKIDSLATLTAVVRTSDQPRLAEALVMATRNGSAVVEVTLGDEDDPAAIRLSIVDLGAGQGLVICCEDVTESVRRENDLRRQARVDALTGCANRAAVMAHLEKLVGEEAGPEARVGIVFVDLDKFKQVNDTLGHAAGDALLIVAARRLNGLVRDGDLVGRLGGDEFVLILDCVDDVTVTSLAERVTRALSGMVSVPTGLAELKASCGVALSQPGDTVAELMARADEAMYVVKKRRQRAAEFS